MTDYQRDVSEFLAEVPLFAGIPRDDLRKIADIAEQRLYAAHEVIFDEGTTGDRMYVVVYGQVHIERRAADGKPVQLGTLGARQFFGEMALFDEVHRSATARVSQKSALLLSLGRDVFEALLRGNPDIALRIIACQNRRLRELNDRVVEVDLEARRNAPTLAETVTTEYPHPIAVVFREMDTAVDAGTRLRRTFELAEVIVTYMGALARSCYLASGQASPEIDAELLVSQTSPTLGHHQKLLRLITGFLVEQHGATTGLAAAVHAWLTQRRGRHAPVATALRELTELRNEIKHGAEAAIDDGGARAHLDALAPHVQALLESLAFLRDHPLVHVQSMAFSEDVFHHTVQVCRGAFRAFHAEPLTLPQPLETNRLYALDRARAQPVKLYPWVGVYRCDVCGDREVFLTQRWSGTKLHCIEFARGHRHTPKEVGASVARLDETLSARVRGTAFERR